MEITQFLGAASLFGFEILILITSPWVKKLSLLTANRRKNRITPQSARRPPESFSVGKFAVYWPKLHRVVLSCNPKTTTPTRT